MIAMVLSAERILMFLSVSRCISGCHLYLRSDHFKAADCTLETYTQRRIRIFSAARFQIFRCNRRKQFLNTCRFLLSSFLLLFFWGRLLSCLCFLIKKEKKFCKSQKPGFCEYNAVFSLAHAERTHIYRGMTHLQKHTVYSPSSSGSHTLCGRFICIIMKQGVVSLLEAGGCVSSAACRTSALLADFDLAHWDTAGTASVKITLFCFLLSTKTAFLPLKNQPNIYPPVLLKYKSPLKLFHCIRPVCDDLFIPAVYISDCPQFYSLLWRQ